MPENEPHSNPLAPSDDEHEEDDRLNSKLSNDDFRKLLMTPRVVGQNSSGAAGQATPAFAKPKPATDKKGSTETSNARKKKKSYYAQLKKEEGEREKELQEKYRDRAKERREDNSTDQGQASDISTTANYKAVAPDAKIGQTLAERRKQVIEESKYLGGDMEHTHMVKGLDYALLEKVKAEITAQEQEELEATKKQQNDMEEEGGEEQITFRTKLARNILRTALSRKGPIERNDLFVPGRMTYVFDLDDPYQDIPTAIIRSKADCAGSETSTTLSNNDIVINKLTQILSYLRQGKGRDRKKRNKEKEKSGLKKIDDIANQHEDIFDSNDATAAVAMSKDRRARHNKKASRFDKRETTREGERKKSYFEKPAEEEEDKYREQVNAELTVKEIVSSVNERFGKGNWGGMDVDDGDKTRSIKDQERAKRLERKMEIIDSYAECYPGMMESVDALGDSDDEADYTKMDQGNKKGPVGRWDFETQEEYSSYMSSREALPKAAFQYGVKMADGRKTRRAGPRDEKKELDREWSKIQNIMNKRKSDTIEGLAGAKKPKY